MFQLDLEKSTLGILRTLNYVPNLTTNVVGSLQMFVSMVE